MKIGMMDSGIGGLTVLYEALRLLPDEAYYYYADTDHVPYGEKTAEEIRSYADEAVAFLTAQGCDCVVIACNTATAVAAGYLREKYSISPKGGVCNKHLWRYSDDVLKKAVIYSPNRKHSRTVEFDRSGNVISEHADSI